MTKPKAAKPPTKPAAPAEPPAEPTAPQLDPHADHVSLDSAVWDEAAGAPVPVVLCSCGATLPREA